MLPDSPQGTVALPVVLGFHLENVSKGCGPLFISIRGQEYSRERMRVELGLSILKSIWEPSTLDSEFVSTYYASSVSRRKEAHI